ncbi:MAG: ABC transporter permease [Tannerella sp.]|nr:ABC transporter permease [Tannerella sp.]
MRSKIFINSLISMATYVKQVWNLMRQERLFSVIYILGTGLSVAVVMALSIVFYIKVANIYPEMNRDRMLVLSRGIERSGSGYSAGSVSYGFIRDQLKTLSSVEAVSAVSDAGSNHYVQPDDNRKPIAVKLIYTDAEFWTVFRFRFREGRPFTDADVQSGVGSVVIARSLARKLFGEESSSEEKVKPSSEAELVSQEQSEAGAVGRYFTLDAVQYRICGVVDDASWVTKNSYAQVWAPYSVKSDLLEGWGQSGYIGDMEAYILTPSADDVARVKQEITNNFQRYASQFGEVKLDLIGQPDRHWQNAFRDGDYNIELSSILMRYGLILLILLLVPAISLSGMADSRMERRLAEMGVRRAFGARTSVLMRQVLFENMIFTLLGGLVGLMISYALVLTGGRWLLSTGQGKTYPLPDGMDVILSPSMLLNLNVFGITLTVCFLLNLFSAMIPAWRASRHQIIHSLNIK